MAPVDNFSEPDGGLRAKEVLDVDERIETAHAKAREFCRLEFLSGKKFNAIIFHAAWIGLVVLFSIGAGSIAWALTINKNMGSLQTNAAEVKGQIISIENKSADRESLLLDIKDGQKKILDKQDAILKMSKTNR